MELSPTAAFAAPVTDIRLKELNINIVDSSDRINQEHELTQSRASSSQLDFERYNHPLAVHAAGSHHYLHPGLTNHGCRLRIRLHPGHSLTRRGSNEKGERGQRSLLRGTLGLQTSCTKLWFCFAATPVTEVLMVDDTVVYGSEEIYPESNLNCQLWTQQPSSSRLRSCSTTSVAHCYHLRMHAWFTAASWPLPNTARKQLESESKWCFYLVFLGGVCTYRWTS